MVPGPGLSSEVAREGAGGRGLLLPKRVDSAMDLTRSLMVEPALLLMTQRAVVKKVP